MYAESQKASRLWQWGLLYDGFGLNWKWHGKIDIGNWIWNGVIVNTLLHTRLIPHALISSCRFSDANQPSNITGSEKESEGTMMGGPFPKAVISLPAGHTIPC